MLPDMNSTFNAGLRYLGLPRCDGNTANLKKLNDLLQNAKKYSGAPSTTTPSAS